MKRTLMVFAAALFTLPLQAADTQVVGVWKMKSFYRETQDTKEVEKTYGERPAGTLIYTPGGHIITMGFAEKRVKPAAEAMTDPERLDHFKTMFAYAGKYSVEGSKVVQDVMASWNQRWTGTKLTREVLSEGGRLVSSTPPFPSNIDGKMVRVRTEYEQRREQPVPENAKLAGVWQLKGWLSENQVTGERTRSLGDAPTGLLVMSQGGYFATVGFGEKRPKPGDAGAVADKDAIDLSRSMWAFAGTYKTGGGDKLTWHVEESWNELWTGRTMERDIEQQGDALRIVGRFPSTTTGQLIKVTTEYQRLE
jgi:hypothetical protein